MGGSNKASCFLLDSQLKFAAMILSAWLDRVYYSKQGTKINTEMKCIGLIKIIILMALVEESVF